MKIVYFLVIITFKFIFCDCCPSKCLCSSSYLNCTNFDSFSDLNFKSIKDQKFETIELRPSKKLWLNSSLNLSCLNVTKQVILYNIIGFDSNPFSEWHNLELKLYQSNFDFGTNCSVRSYNETIFDTFSRIILTDSVNYPNSLCPFVFRNNSIEQLSTFSMKSDNFLKFKKIDQNIPEYYMPKINQLFLYNNEMDNLNESLLEPYVFGKLKTLQVFGKLDSFDKDLLYKFPNLKYLSFEMVNFDEFISNADWFASLPNNLVLGLSDLRQSFDFSDQNFCLFKNFPQQRQIIPVLKSKSLINCSCTMIWLIKNSFGNNLIRTQTIEKCLEDRKSFENKIEECNFEVKIKNCEPSAMINLGTSSPINLKTSKTSTWESSTKDNVDQSHIVIKTFALVIGSVGFLTISAIMGLFLFITR